jgi:hypothetical protein
MGKNNDRTMMRLGDERFFEKDLFGCKIQTFGSILTKSCEAYLNKNDFFVDEKIGLKDNLKYIICTSISIDQKVRF